MYEMDSMVRNSGQMNSVNGLELFDFFDVDANTDIDHFVNLIRGENEEPFANFCHDDDLIGGCLLVGDDSQFGRPAALEGDIMLGNFNSVTGLMSSLDDHHRQFMKDHDLGLEAYDDDDDDDDDDQEEEDNARQESSEANTGSTSTAKDNKSKVDRSRTLISERRRRGKMKEKLYALRALVPNITKMDKASIVGDAVRYVKELQMQAKKLKEEIGDIEASLLLGQDQTYKASNSSINYMANNINQRKFHRIVTNSNQLMMISKSVIQMEMFQVEERGFYMRLACNKGDGIAASIYKVLESLTSFNIQSSNLASAMDRLELTVTLRVKDGVKDMNLPNLKLWVVGALLNEGFEFKSSFCL